MEKNGTKTEYHGTPPKKFGKSNAVVLSLRADLTIRKMSDSVWHFLMYAGIIAIPVVYPEIHVQPCAIFGGKYLAGLRIATYLCR